MPPRSNSKPTDAADDNAADVDDGSPLIRLQRVLAMAGAGSRRHCEDFILTGRVTIDGKTVRELGARVDPSEHDIRLDGEKVISERKVYYILNKPTGFLCTHNDPEGRSRVSDLFPNKRERLFTVGRLDENSQGLLLVTNDGELAHRLAHPRFSVPKTYRVHVAGVPTRETLEQLRSGLHFAEGKFKVHGVRQLKIKGKSSILEIVLTEGQNREIRRLLAKMGHKVLTLERVALGPLKLGTIPLGHYRPLTPPEVAQLRRLASGAPLPKPKARRPSKPPRTIVTGLRHASDARRRRTAAAGKRTPAPGKRR